MIFIANNEIKIICFTVFHRCSEFTIVNTYKFTVHEITNNSNNLPFFSINLTDFNGFYGPKLPHIWALKEPKMLKFYVFYIV